MSSTRLLEQKLTYRYMDTYRSACTSHPELITFIPRLELIFNAWVDNIGQTDQLMKLPTKNKDYLIDKIKIRMGLLTKAVNRVLQAKIEPERQEHTGKVVPTPDGLLAALERYVSSAMLVRADINRNYNGPGEFSEHGAPRHDNGKSV